MTPPQILAIEPDRWRGSQLKTIARRIGAELRLTDSMDGALAALTDRLRRLGEAAAHIQTLTIPTLHTAELSGGELSLSSTRMFAALRKDRSSQAGPAACDTDTFAEQVAFYLMGATEARRKHAPAAVSGELPPKPSQAAASVAVDPSFDELDLTACISEELLDQTPVHSISASERAGDLTTIEAELEAALSSALADVTAEEFQDFLPEDLTAVPAQVPEESPLSEFDSEGPPPSSVAAELNGWQRIDPAKPRFAALLAKLDEIALRPG